MFVRALRLAASLAESEESSVAKVKTISLLAGKDATSWKTASAASRLR